MLKSFLIDCTAREGSKDFLCEKRKERKKHNRRKTSHIVKCDDLTVTCPAHPYEKFLWFLVYI